MKIRTTSACLAGLLLSAMAFQGTIASEGADLSQAGTDPLSPLDASEWDFEKARHLLSRAGFGGTPQQVSALQAMGLEQAVDHLVDYQKIPEPEFALAIEPSPRPRLKFDRRALEGLDSDERRAMLEKQRRKARVDRKKLERKTIVAMRGWWIQRMIQSPRPLEEKLVLFWHGHFASGIRTVKSTYAMHEQNKLFREHAAGNFGRLLHGVVHDPAMLRYLDNFNSVKSHPNENLAREIMELFTLGEGNYTEKDIQEAARALTGYSIDRDTCQFEFRSRAHDSGEKTIFGKTGNWDGDQLVDLILEQPATARWIAGKLFAFLVHEQPDEPVVEALAAILRDENYELRPMLKTLFLSKQFYSAEAMGTQVKSPIQLIVGTVRSLGVESPNTGALASASQAMGQDLYQPPNVKGWDGGHAWINTNSLFSRQNFAARLLVVQANPGKKTPRNKRRGAAAIGIREIDFSAVLAGKDLKTAEEVVDYLAKACLMVPLTESKRLELIEFADSGEPMSLTDQTKAERKRLNQKLRGLLLLIMSLPEYQVI